MEQQLNPWLTCLPMVAAEQDPWPGRWLSALAVRLTCI